ncbi:MAG TPA: hypothetical protein VHI13_06765 [Candidatus Kapabacteria bacterium]|nr:hypothetical protein [Candidatus Kapabacteria bacterium]
MKIFLSCTLLLCLAVAAHMKAQPVEEGRTAVASPRGVESTGPYPVLTLPGHRDWVRSVAFDETGMRLVSTSYDSTVRTWKALTGDSLLTLHGHIVRYQTNPSSLSRYFRFNGSATVGHGYQITARVTVTFCPSAEGRDMPSRSIHARYQHAQEVAPFGGNCNLGATKLS